MHKNQLSCRRKLLLYVPVWTQTSIFFLIQTQPATRRAARSTSTVSRRRLWMRDRTMLALTLATKLSARLSREDCCLAALTFARGCAHMPPLAMLRVVTASSLMAAATMEMIMVEEGHCRSTSTTLRVQAQSSSRGPTESTCNAATTTSAEAVRNINALFGAFYAENHFHQGRLGTNMGKVEKRGVFRRGAFKLRREMSARPPLPPCPRAAPLAKHLKVVLAGV